MSDASGGCEDNREVGGVVVALGRNVYFWLYQDTGYFAANSAEVPLLHLWSLGVEEQFYVLWPCLLIACYRPGRWRFFLLAAGVVAFASFLCAVLFARAPSFVYYTLPTRAGELLLGALVAIAVLGVSNGDWRQPQLL